MNFDATLPGTSAATWEQDYRLAEAPVLGLGRVTSILVVAAHPDDETLGAGGLIAECASRGIPVHVVIVTDGAASHPRSAIPAEELVELRAREARSALDALGVDIRLTTLGFPDGQTLEQRDGVASALSAIIGETEPTTLIVAPWTGDGHRDHRVVGEECVRVAGERRLIGYPVWMWHWATPESPEVPWSDLVALEIDPVRKHTAIAAYASQIHPLSDAPGDEAMLRGDFLEHFEGSREVFVEHTTASLAADYFDAVYAKNSDPWRLATRWYEERKRSITVASLPSARYGSALEIGCSIGMLTTMLADRCDDVLALDVSASAVGSATERTADRDNVEVRLTDATTDFPDGSFDLIVISEVGYYFSRPALEHVIAEARSHLADGGTIIACHWRHPVSEYLQSGDAVHETIAEQLGLPHLVRHLETDFVIDVYSSDDRSVARREGLA